MPSLTRLLYAGAPFRRATTQNGKVHTKWRENFILQKETNKDDTSVASRCERLSRRHAVRSRASSFADQSIVKQVETETGARCRY